MSLNRTGPIGYGLAALKAPTPLGAFFIRRSALGRKRTLHHGVHLGVLTLSDQAETMTRQCLRNTIRCPLPHHPCGPMRKRPPGIDGLAASTLQLPPGAWLTVLDCLCA